MAVATKIKLFLNEFLSTGKRVYIFPFQSHNFHCNTIVPPHPQLPLSQGGVTRIWKVGSLQVINKKSNLKFRGNNSVKEGEIFEGR